MATDAMRAARAAREARAATDAAPLDCVIVGGGIAGLYAAYMLKRASPGARVLVLERDAEPGGRVLTTEFAGLRELPCGAGVGRAEKDHVLARLLRDFGLPTRPFRSRPAYNEPGGDARAAAELREDLARLRAHFRPDRERRRAFRAFALEAFGGDAARYERFAARLGYTDYEAEDAYETMRHYGLADNYAPLAGFSVPWRALVAALVAAIGPENVRTRATVTRIAVVPGAAPGAAPPPLAEVTYEAPRGAPGGGGPRRAIARAALAALPADGLRTLFPDASVYETVRGQPFLRVYARFAASARAEMAARFPRATILSDLGDPALASLQKVFPIRPDRGVYLITYSDNARALAHAGDARRLQDTPAARAYWEGLLGVAPGAIRAIRACYWPAGTHYYAPLPPEYASRAHFLRAARRPLGRRAPVFAAGEAISRDQGWTHGAFDSVAAILPDLQKMIGRAPSAAAGQVAAATRREA